MVRKKMVWVLVVITIIINIGVWLTGVYGIEIHLGTHVLGQHVGINEQ
jgi:hypothetical protein